MTLQQLIYVVTVAEQNSINHAAQNLFISQSSLSAAIQNLEKEIGMAIFRRTNRGVTITPEGEEFLNYAQQIVDQFRLTEDKYLLKKGSKQSFSVSSQHFTFAVKAFIEMAKEFGPDRYSLGIYECKTAEIIENVRSYRSELGVIYLDDFNSEVIQRLLADNALEFTELFLCGTYVFMAKSNPLASRESVSLEELAPYPCLSFDQGSNQSFYLAEEVYSTYNYNQQIKASDRATVLNLMLGLDAYILCPGILSESLYDDDYAVVPLQSDKVMHIGYISRKGCEISRLGEMFIDKLKLMGDSVLPMQTGGN